MSIPQMVREIAIIPVQGLRWEAYPQVRIANGSPMTSISQANLANGSITDGQRFLMMMPLYLM